MTRQNRLSADGRVTIPLDVREALGLKPGEPVAFSRNAAGEMVVRRGDTEIDSDKHASYDDMMRRIAEAHRLFPPLPLDMTTDEYMAMIREPVPLPRE